MARDTTDDELERLRSENENLRDAKRIGERHDQLVELFNFAPLAYLVLDGIGTICEANAAAVAMLSGSDRRGPIVGTRLKVLLHEEDYGTLAAHLRSCPGRDNPLSCEVRLRDSTPLQLWSRQIRSGLRLYPTMLIDLRDRVKADEEARRVAEAEKTARSANEAKDQFIAVLSHELRTPLTPVLAAVTALSGRAEVPEDLRKIFEMIQRNVITEARLIDDLLDVTRITQRKMHVERQPLDIHESAREVLETLSLDLEAKHLSVGIFLDAQNHRAAADPLRLKQVFWNLVRNAVKFTPDGGKIEVRSWNHTVDGKQWLHVEVSDSGMGFEPEIAPKLFEPFEQGSDDRKRGGGLGLGLAICKGVMDLHGGKITAISRGSGTGARFVIDIETTDEAPQVAQGRPVQPQQRPKSLTILLVEDDEDTSATLGELLTEVGFVVRFARSAKPALAVDFDGVDLLISDIGLPDLSGLELIKLIRKDHQVGAIALSGYGTEADIKASFDAGFAAHLTKPFEFSALLATIADVSAAVRDGGPRRRSVFVQTE